MMRKPSDLGELYTYWHLALESWPQAEAWRVENEERFQQWDSLPGAIFPGWYRVKWTSLNSKYQHLRGRWVPVVIWLEQPIGEDGQLLDQELLKVKTGHTREMDEHSGEHHEVSLWMTWESCRRNPVSVEAYEFAMRAYSERSVYQWADDKAEEPPKPTPIDLARARPVF
jgi:hypothetical protein